MVYIDLNVTLRCVSSGAEPKVTDVTWYHNMEEVQQVMGRISFNNNGKDLVITRVESSDTGNYVCSASNGPFTESSPTRHLSVISECIW